MSESKSASVVFTNGSLLAKNAQNTANSAKTTAENAQLLASGAQKTADGKNSVYRGSDPSTVPTAGLKAGDIYFTDNALYTWNGTSWEETVSDTTGEKIHAKVEAAMEESQKLVADLKADVATKVKDLDDEIEQNKIQTGNALNFYKEQYYLSTSYTELVGGSWSDEVPQKTEGKYIWSRYVTANVGNPTDQQYSDPVCISGLDGDQGPQGPQGEDGKSPQPNLCRYNCLWANSAKSVSYDSATNTYTIVNNTPDPQWGSAVSIVDSDKVLVPFGGQYVASADIYTPVAMDMVVDFNNWPVSGNAWVSNDNDDVANRATYNMSVPANTWTKVSWTAKNTSPNNADKVDLIIVDSIGSKAPAGTTWKLRNLKIELGSVATPWVPNEKDLIGPKGDTGDQGIPGPKGVDGQTTYVHFAYANSADGKTNFNTSYFNDAIYVGTYTDYTQTDSNDYTKYTWSRLKGDAGQTGATGPKGDTGSTGFFIGTTPPPNPTKGTVWATNDASGNMVSAKTWNGSNWVSTAFTQDLVAGNITASKIVGGELDVNKITVKNAQNIPVTSTVSLGDKLSNIEQDAKKIKFSMAGQGLDLVDGLDGELIMGYGIADTTWDGHNACLTLPSTSMATEVLPQNPPFVNLYAWEAGKTYTQSIIIETDAQIDTSIEPAWTWFTVAGHNWQPAELIDLGNNCYRLIGSYTPVADTAKNPLRILDIANFNGFIKINTGTYLKFRSPHIFCADDNSLSELKLTSSSLNAYVRGSNGSDTLASILRMDPKNSVIGQVVNGNLVAGINMSSDGDLKIVGNKLHITADTKIENAVIKSAMIDSIDASKITTGELNAEKVKITHLTADKITSGTLHGISITGGTITGATFVSEINNYELPDNDGNVWTDYKVTMDSNGMDITGTYNAGTSPTAPVYTTSTARVYGDRFYQQLHTNDWDRVIDINTEGKNPSIELTQSWASGRHAYTYVGSDMIWSQQVKASDGWFGNWHFTGPQVRSEGSLYVANESGTNFDGNGSVGFQVWNGIGLGANTMYLPSTNLYIQMGNCGPGLGASYSSSSKVDVHCNRVISERANSVSSRLSVKTDITPVSYDRALAAVEGTDMYDYRYVSDDSGQHYVSGIIDDVNADPQYHMDGMLINKERTARIDANLTGYHHVIIQKLLERVAALEEKVK